MYVAVSRLDRVRGLPRARVRNQLSKCYGWGLEGDGRLHASVAIIEEISVLSNKSMTVRERSQTNVHEPVLIDELRNSNDERIVE